MFKLTIFCLILSLYLTDAARQCLLPNFEANTTTDGLTNCTCSDGLEYDEMFGVCFENKCKQNCRDMDCAIRKHTKARFEYLCYCKEGYVTLSPMFKLRCVPFESLPGNNEISKNLPKNPLLNKKLNCEHTYEIDENGNYQCKCLEGYTYSQFSKNCVLMKRCKRRCGLNQRCTVDDQNNTHCVCKTGFFGPDCMLNWCDHKKNVTEDEKVYIEAATRNFCGTNSCKLNEKTDDFECECPYATEKANDGTCHVKKPCLPGNVGYQKCSADDAQFCSVRSDEFDGYKCRCAMETGYNLRQQCNEYHSNFVKPENITHNLSMKIRLDWNAEGYESFTSLFSNHLWNLLDTNVERKYHGSTLQEFLDYEQNVYRTYENVAFYREILEDKLRKMFLKGIEEFDFLKNCGNYSVYPELSYNKTTLKLTRLIETVFEVNYLINCEQKLNANDLLDKFKNEHLLQDYIENYFYLKKTGYVYPESVQLN